MKPNYTYKAHIKRIVDGDTIDVELDIGFNLCFKTKLRLSGVNTPELKSKNPVEREKAEAARAYVESQLLDKTVFITTEKSDAFGRYLAVVYLERDDGTWYDFNQVLLTNGYAINYKRG